MRFRRHDSGVREGCKQAPDHLVEAGAIVWSALGAPSAGLSLGGLLASRARLRFTRRAGCTAMAIAVQEQAEVQQVPRSGWPRKV